MENKYSIIIFLVLGFLLSSCQINPATGQKELSLISTKEEDDIGKSEHKKIIKQFGIYENRKLQNYVNSRVRWIVRLFDEILVCHLSSSSGGIIRK